MRVRDRDFPDEELGKITPYGICDVAANRGFVSVGASCDTAAFAVNALRLWWRREGSLRYPDARRLLVTCDAGGSARDEQAEQDRAPPVLPYHPHLARPAPDDEGGRGGRDRPGHHLPGPEGHCRPR